MGDESDRLVALPNAGMPANPDLPVIPAVLGGGTVPVIMEV
jgi:hypothetical protein